LSCCVATTRGASMEEDEERTIRGTSRWPSLASKRRKPASVILVEELDICRGSVGRVPGVAEPMDMARAVAEEGLVVAVVITVEANIRDVTKVVGDKEAHVVAVIPVQRSARSRAPPRIGSLRLGCTRLPSGATQSVRVWGMALEARIVVS
jgi:hypothetical protein